MTSTRPTRGSASAGSSRPAFDRRGLLVHRIGAVVVAVIISVFGVLGLVGGLSFFDTTGAPVLGLSTNGALATISLVTALVLVAAVLRGGKLASIVMTVVGALFLVSAFVNLWLIGTAGNLLAFRLPNVFFSIGAGLVLLTLGAFGRFSGRCPTTTFIVSSRALAARGPRRSAAATQGRRRGRGRRGDGRGRAPRRPRFRKR